MKRQVISILLCAAMLLSTAGLAGCAGKAAAETPSGASPASGPRGAPLPPAEMLAVAATPDPALAGEASAAALGFAADLLRQTAGSNRLLSPLSVLCALGMVLGGAEGETRSQMEAALSVSGNALNAFLGPWLAALAAEDGALHVADGIWIADRPDLRVSEDFLRLNRECYGAAVEQCPLDAAAVERINAFVKERTHGMIDKLLDGLPDAAVMVLVNRFPPGEGRRAGGDLSSLLRIRLFEGRGHRRFYEALQGRALCLRRPAARGRNGAGGLCRFSLRR